MVSESVSQLPPEILDYILSLLPPSSLQSTTLALGRALADRSTSRALLYRHLRLTREGQSWEIGQILRNRDQELRGSVRTVKAEVWRDDPQLLVNLLQSFPSLSKLDMTVGPLSSPEVMEELLSAAKWKYSIQSLNIRFNPYVMERSYYTFLKGTYYDTIMHTIASWPTGTAPKLKQLSFIQDLSPNYGAKRIVVPAFGLSSSVDLEEALPEEEEEKIEEQLVSANGVKKKDYAFAQPIVFFKLDCLTNLATSPSGSQLTHFVIRLPRRNLLPCLTTYPLTPLPHPFSSLIHLDLSTTHLLANSPQFPLLLRLHPELQYITLDLVTGLIGKAEQKEPTAVLTMKWVGKCCGGIGLNRSEDVMRGWRKCVKDRPTGLPAEGPPAEILEEEISEDTAPKKERKSNRSGFGNMPKKAPVKMKNNLDAVNALFKSRLPMLVKDLLIIPSAPKLKSLGFGVLAQSQLHGGTEKVWQKASYAVPFIRATLDSIPTTFS